MEGTTDILCENCRSPIKWDRIGFIEDGIYDWRLDIFCDCGEVKDPKIRKLIRYAYGDYIGNQIAKSQEAALIQRIGEPLNNQLNSMADGTLASAFKKSI